MPDSLALSVYTLVAAGLIALAMVWPQGQGARSPAPFGHPLAAIVQTAPNSQSGKPETLRGPQPAPVPKHAKKHTASAPKPAPAPL
jgi:hypothetical protein